MDDVTAHELAFARATGAVLATVRQANPLADAGSQQDLTVLGFKGATAGFDGDLECHTQRLETIKMRLSQIHKDNEDDGCIALALSA
jgi:hypothetical protein